MTISMENQIISVFRNNVRIGFITRRHNIYGYAQEIPPGWCWSTDLKSGWIGNFATRQLAIKDLISDVDSWQDVINGKMPCDENSLVDIIWDDGSINHFAGAIFINWNRVRKWRLSKNI